MGGRQRGRREAGHIYVADFENHRIQVFGRDGNLLSVFGQRGESRSEFERPTDLDVGSDGRIYVVDFGNNRIQVFGQCCYTHLRVH